MTHSLPELPTNCFNLSIPENAIKEMTIDVIQQLEKATRQLSSATSTEDEQIEAIEIIEDYVDNIDTANDFCKIGGLDVIVPCLTSPYPSVRSKIASLCAELAQNNPYSQQHLLDANALPKLIELLQEPETASAAIHGISCMVRNFEPSLAAFIDIGGLECLLGCLQQVDNDKLIIRSLFLLSAICAEFPPVRDELIKLKAVEQIVAMLRPSNGYDVRLETTLSALYLFTENEESIIKCQEPDLNFLKTLDAIVKQSQGDSACAETLEYCKILKERVFNSKQDSTDR